MVLPVDPAFQQGILAERQIQQQHRKSEQRDAASAISSWRDYAAKLEHQAQQLHRALGQAKAESYAAQYQRNVLASQLDQLQAEIRRLNPGNVLGDEAKLIAAARELVDQHLRSKGLRIDRSDPRVFRVIGHLP